VSVAPPWPYPRLIGHRGGGTLAPENTLAGLRLARRYGYTGVEFDVMLSGDGTPVLIHDDTLERTTDGHGRVVDRSDAELARLDAGSWHGPAYAGEPLPTFAQAGELCRVLGLWANVEIKPAPGHEAETGRRAALLARELWQGADLAPLLSSFSPVALAAAAQAAPQLPRGLLCGPVPDTWHADVQRLGCFSLHCDFRHVTPRLVDEAARRGVPLVCYTVNDPDEARRLLGLGVAAVITDRLDLLAPHGL
jgi:glycerophosphoryl diester phosphodiesterase